VVMVVGMISDVVVMVAEDLLIIDPEGGGSAQINTMIAAMSSVVEGQDVQHLPCVNSSSYVSRLSLEVQVYLTGFVRNFLAWC